MSQLCSNHGERRCATLGDAAGLLSAELAACAPRQPCLYSHDDDHVGDGLGGGLVGGLFNTAGRRN